MKRTITVALALVLAVPLSAQEKQPNPTTQPEPAAQEAQPPAPPSTEGEQTSEVSSAPAETELTTDIRVDLGLQSLDQNNNSSKFLEYLDVKDGLVVPFLQIRGTGRTGFSFLAEDMNEEDQRYHLGIERGNFRLNAFYDQIIHRLGNDGRSILETTSPGVHEMSDTIQRAHQTALEQQFAANSRNINFAFLRNLVSPSVAAAHEEDLGIRRDRSGAEFGYDLDGLPLQVTLSVLQENRRGDRGAGTSFGFSNVVETAEPIDYETTDVTATAVIPIGQGFVRGALNVNEFANEVSWLMFDNPFRVTDSTSPNAYQAPGSASIDGPSRGRVDLPADSNAITASLGYAGNFALRSRLTADLSVGQWRQDEQFLPYTTNTAITVPFDATNPANLPVQNLDGEINTFNGALSFSMRPTEDLSINARYRLYDLSNDTPRVEFPGYVRFDAVWEDIPRISVPYGWSNNRFDVNASYDIGRLVNAEVGYRLDRMERTFRETRETDENVISLAASVKPLTWAAFRASYEFGDRDYDEYDPERAEHASYLDPGPPVNLQELRRFDQAKRDLNRINALLQLTPFGMFGVNVHYTQTKYDYDSNYGLLDSDENALTTELDYTPSERWNVYGFYTYANLDSFQRGRQSGGSLSTNPLDDWTANIEYQEDVWGLGGNFSILPERLNVKLFARRQQNAGYNDLDSPPGGTPDIAVDIAQMDDIRYWSGSVELEYRLRPEWRLTGGAWLEEYEINDVFNQGVGNYMPGGFFLAPSDADYTGNVLYLRATYRR